MELHEVICQYEKDLTREGSVEREFGIADSKGRQLGAKASKFTAVRVHQPRMVYTCYPQYKLNPEGPVWGYQPSARRGGFHFGATQSIRWFSSPEARDAAIDGYFVRAEKAASKKA
jgi:hypothetical protein